jgi:hypothetical protein
MQPSSITTSAAKTADSVATVPPAITLRLPLTATGSRYRNGPPRAGVSIWRRSGVHAVKTALSSAFAAYAGRMTAPSHLASIRELRDIRRERPRVSGESEDHYYERLALELRRRLRAQRRRDFVIRVLRREARA